uniref:G-patch domain-containing protein n=1 Tax=Panagrellus redivivus TaxID=6233 RepID=A0A7E4V2Y4_PANRE
MGSAFGTPGIRAARGWLAGMGINERSNDGFGQRQRRAKFRTCDDDGRRRPGRTTSVTRTALSRSRAAPYGPHRAGLATVTGRRRLSSAVTMLSDHHLQPQSA